MSQTSIRILVADDHPVVRDGLAAVLNGEPDFEVVAQASNGQEAIHQFRLHQPDVTVMDLQMPQVSGTEAIATIRAEFPSACFVMLTVYDGDEDIYQGFRAGAKAYLLKDTPCEEIADVIREVCHGNRYIPEGVGAQLATHLELPTLSDRERQVLKLMSSGKGNKAIAKAMNVTEGTIKFHVNNILTKLGVGDRTHAVVTALKRGIIRL
ncbi:response regulator transcription factor [Oscillatoria sp. FACHB-1407]|uniref:response regulator n=1 Tax=Oscillatoria sp. FACHB-1407 TaxID=2692847 RepID=UPI00168A1A8C|nr:response regulator transcription factor [Oscillatoria sp. FACHB-1407]MBD2463523.1 response regulator transcription factor [Oscillatoria sp. FACHB-1407]